MAKPRIKSTRLRLRLYVAGNAPNSIRAIANVRAICDEHFASGHDLEIVDLLTPAEQSVLDQLSVFTKGGVISPGEQIMLIVPEADVLVAEVRIPPQNIDQVRLNQLAILRFPTFNQRTTPELNGSVKRIAAETLPKGFDLEWTELTYQGDFGRQFGELGFPAEARSEAGSSRARRRSAGSAASGTARTNGR
jgi:hypothetical protein